MSMLKLKSLLTESMELQTVAPLIQHAQTFDQFLKSLVGKPLTQFLDMASFTRLYVGNKYGIGPEPDKTDPKVLLSDLLSFTTDYINYRKITPLRAQLDAKDAEDRNTPAYAEYHKQRMALVKAKFQAAKAGDTETVDKLQTQVNALEDPSSYRKNMDDMQTLVKQFHNSPLTLADVTPAATDSEEDKERLHRAEEAFKKLKSLMS